MNQEISESWLEQIETRIMGPEGGDPCGDEFMLLAGSYRRMKRELEDFKEFLGRVDRIVSAEGYCQEDDDAIADTLSGMETMVESFKQQNATLTRQLSECQARERDKDRAIKIVLSGQSAILGPSKVKLLKDALSLPSDSTALDRKIAEAIASKLQDIEIDLSSFRSVPEAMKWINKRIEYYKERAARLTAKGEEKP